LRDIEPETYWGHDTRYVIDHVTIRYPMLFPIGAPLKPTPYLQALESYSTPNISRSRPCSIIFNTRSFSRSS